MKTRGTETADRSTPSRQRLESWLWGGLFLAILLYVWKGIGPHLLYYGFGVFTPYPVFSLDSSYLRTTFTTPGGPLEALAALLAQTYQVSWLGALVISAILGLLFLGTRRLLRSVRVVKFRDFAWFPVLLALPIYSYYYEDPLPTLLAVTLSVWTATFCATRAQRTWLGRTGSLAILFPTLYYLIGASAFVFAAIACLIEALQHRKIVSALVQAILAVGAAFVIGRLLVGPKLQAIYTVGTPWDPSNDFSFSPLANLLTIDLYAFGPVLMLVALASRILLEFEASKSPPAGHQKKRHEPNRKSGPATRWRNVPHLRPGLRMLVVTMVTIPCLMFSRTYKRHERALHYYAELRRWDRVLALADRMAEQHAFTRCGVFDINRALAHQGQLGSRLCAFPQDDTGMLFMTFEDMSGRLQHAKSLDLYLDLGYLNLAEKNAYELLDLMGPSPHVLERLLRIHLAKGQHEAARVVFGALKKYAGSGAYVRRWQSIIADPAQVQSDPLIQTYRKVRATEDDTSIEVSLQTLQRRLAEVPNHRLAFEYLMAGYLLRHERVELIGHLSMLKSLGYRQLPRHLAEALLVHSLETGTPLQTQGWTIDPDLQRQFHEIRSVVTRTGGINQAAFETLAPKYGNTYMFYSMFNQCGLR